MVYNMVRNEQDAWDLSQDGFLKAWKSIGRFTLALSVTTSGVASSSFSNSASWLPLNLPSTHAVYLSSKVFINIAEQGLEFLAGVKKSGHHSANGAAEHVSNFLVFESVQLAQNNHLAVLIGKLG